MTGPATALQAQSGHTPAAPHINACWPTDHGFPVIDSVTVTPDDVDVTADDVSVTVSVTAHDTGGPGAASGIQRVSAAGPWDTTDPLERSGDT